MTLLLWDVWNAGLTTTEMVAIIATTMLVLALWLHDFLIVLIMGALLGGCLGFLRKNWAPARIYLGDAGSLTRRFGRTFRADRSHLHHLMLRLVGGRRHIVFGIYFMAAALCTMALIVATSRNSLLVWKDRIAVTEILELASRLGRRDEVEHGLAIATHIFPELKSWAHPEKWAIPLGERKWAVPLAARRVVLVNYE